MAKRRDEGEPAEPLGETRVISHVQYGEDGTRTAGMERDVYADGSFGPWRSSSGGEEHGTGYIPDPDDQNVIRFEPRGSTPKRARRLPTEVMIPGVTERVSDQRSIGSCVGQSVTDAAEIVARRPKADGTPGIEVEWSRLLTYLLGRIDLYGLTLEGYLANKDPRVSRDTGAMIGGAVRMVNRYGFCSEALWPYDISKYAATPPKSVFEQAKRHVLLQYRSIENHEALMQALYEGHPVVLGFDVPTNFGVDASGVMRRHTGQFNGGHAVLAIGYRSNYEIPSWGDRGVAVIRNSWGSGWGGGSDVSRGHYLLPFSFFNSQYVSDAWALVAQDVEA